LNIISNAVGHKINLHKLRGLSIHEQQWTNWERM
jgi:hypothetical protein